MGYIGSNTLFVRLCRHRTLACIVIMVNIYWVFAKCQTLIACAYLMSRSFWIGNNYGIILLMRKLKYKELTNLHKVLGLRAINTELKFELVDLIQCNVLYSYCTNSKRVMMVAALINLFYKALLECAYMCAKSLQSCPILWDSTNCSLPGSSVHEILQEEYWSGLPCPPPEDLPDPGMEPMSLMSPAGPPGKSLIEKSTVRSWYLSTF